MWVMCGHMWQGRVAVRGFYSNVRHSNTYNPARLINDECQMYSDRPGDHMEMFEPPFIVIIKTTYDI